MIYLAVDTKSTLVKIGFSESPQYREKQLKTGNPNFKMFFILMGGTDLEKSIHKRFQPYRFDLEWFSLSKTEIYNIIEEFQSISIFFDKNLLESIDFIPQKKSITLTEQEYPLVEILDNTDSTYNITYLARNLFIAEYEVINLLNKLKKKKYLKYTKKGQTISISVNQAGCAIS